jgi:hypothetical protein
VWELVLAINALRNELAHKLNSAERNKKLTKVRNLYLREAAGSKNIEQVKKGF